MNRYSFLIPIVLLSIAAWLIGCATPAPTESSLTDRAAAEATIIVQRAEATAIVMRAQATANAMLQIEVKPTPTLVAPPLTSATRIPSPQASPILSAPLPAVTQERNSLVEIVGVGFAADGGLIIVQFKAPPEVARVWNQTNVYILDEATDTKYDDVPVTPLVGPLLGRPKYDGQLGYVMFYNTNAGIRPGSIVTVVFGDYKQQHLVVQQ